MRPPLVTVIISNYNYAQFLGEAVASVKGQQYPHIECIVVDDASTDDSAAVIESLGEKWPDIVCVRQDENLGQSAAILAGLARAKGQYVLLLDSDDVLSEDCVSTHLAVHMSSARAVGFTCCDALQISDGYLVKGRNSSIAQQFGLRPVDPHLLSKASIERVAREKIVLPWIPSEDVRYVQTQNLDWVWSTTSCMLFRREALDLVCGAAELASMRIGTDNYLAFVTNLWTGSILIDRPLVDYRIHGKNGFAKRVHLDGFSGSDKCDDHTPQSQHVLLTDLEARFGYYASVVDSPGRLVGVVAAIRTWLVNSGAASPGRTNPIALLLKRNRDAWEPMLGTRVYEHMLETASELDLTNNIVPLDGKAPEAPVEPEPVVVSAQSVREIATEVWFEKQRWGFPYKLGKRFSRARQT